MPKCGIHSELAMHCTKPCTQIGVEVVGVQESQGNFPDRQMEEGGSNALVNKKSEGNMSSPP